MRHPAQPCANRLKHDEVLIHREQDVVPCSPVSAGRKMSAMISLDRAYRHDLCEAHLEVIHPPTERDTLTDTDLARLPPTVRRYMHFMGVTGRPRDWSFRAEFLGRFRRTPTESWMPCRALQYNTRLGIARIFTMRVVFARALPMIGHDTYVRGTGRMVGRLLGVFKVVDGKGAEFDTGELTTYLNDAVLLAPSMLLGTETKWTGVDDHTFDVALTDLGRTVTARVVIDDHGAPRDFITTDRYAALPEGLVQARWNTPIPSWTMVDGRPFPGPTGATWALPDGPFTYVEGGFVPGSVVYNIGLPV